MATALLTGTGQALSVPTQVAKAPTVASYVYSKDDPGESIYSNVVGPLDQPNALRYAVTAVPDIFKASPITQAIGQRSDGFNFLAQVNEVWKVYDDANAAVIPYYLPLSAHMVLKLPTSAVVTAAAVRDLILRLVGSLCRNGTDAYDVAIGPFLHGITRL